MVLLTALGAAAAPPAAAQVSLGLRVGVVGSSELVHDSIVEPISVRPRLAPAIAARVSLPFRGRFHFSADLGVSRSDLESRADTTTVVTSLTVWAPTAAVGFAPLPWIQTEARLGLLIYDPSITAATLFGDGAPVTPLLGLGLNLLRGLGAGFGAAIHVQYDVHRFTTDALEARGFTGRTAVHRVSVGLSLSRDFGHASPAN